MFLDYAKIKLSKDGQPEQPILRLRTLAGKELGVVTFASNVKIEVNYTDLSKIEFDIPYQTDGLLNPIYHMITGYKVLYTDLYGIFVLMTPQINGDGVSETKHVVGYSLEEMFERKMLFLEEGTYDFWNPADPSDTILGRVVELDPSWKVGYVAPRLISCYRTFEEYDNDALNFCYGDAMERYRCAIVFDVYKKTINAYDANEDNGTLPIYLSYDNLVSEVSVEELTDEIVTKLHVYGADDLSIREVNPTGSDYLVDLSFFIQNGDLDIVAPGGTKTLAERVQSWQKEILNRQKYYTGLVSVRASKTAEKISEEAKLTQLNGELNTLTAQQSVTIQAIALAKTEIAKQEQEALLITIKEKIERKNSEIAAQEQKVNLIAESINGYTSDIKSVTNELSFEKYFTDDEQVLLIPYLIEDDLTEDTFVASTVEATVQGEAESGNGSVSIQDSKIVQIDMASTHGKTMFTMEGGTITVTSGSIAAGIVRGTLEINTSGSQFVLSLYLGKTLSGEKSYDSGLLTISGDIANLSGDIISVDDNGVTELLGTALQFDVSEGRKFFTVNVSEYQRYSVAKELFDYGADVLSDRANAVYEFTLNSANFLFIKEFEPFKNKLELGKAIHLNLASEGHVCSNLLGISLNFEDFPSLSLTFSNQYRHNQGIETLSGMIKKTYSSSRSFNSKKYLYNQVANKTTQVSEFMESDLDAAVKTIWGAANKTVAINSGGIQVGGDSRYQLRIVDNMIAMTDDGWETAKLALGLFSTPGVDGGAEHWGVNTEMLAGKLIIGNKMVLENATDEGVMMFKIDETGAWLYNSTFVLQSNGAARTADSGIIIIDPKYGIVAGTGALFNANGTTVTPEFIDECGDITLDSEGMPENANFFLDMRDGSAYFRGTVRAKAGAIGGWTLKDNYLYGGSGSSFVALNGDSANTESAFAIWAGNSDPTKAPFWVKKNGDFYAKSGMFKGTIQANKYLDASGNEMMSGGKWKSDYLDVRGLNVGNGNLIIDENGNVTLKTGTITWDGGEPGLSEEEVQQMIDDNAYELPTYITQTVIGKGKIQAPNIYGTHFAVYPESASSTRGSFSIYGNSDGSQLCFYQISYQYPGYPIIMIDSPAGGTIEYYGSHVFQSDCSVSFVGSVDFSSATVTGLDMLAKFG